MRPRSSKAGKNFQSGRCLRRVGVAASARARGPAEEVLHARLRVLQCPCRGCGIAGGAMARPRIVNLLAIDGEQIDHVALREPRLPGGRPDINGRRIGLGRRHDQLLVLDRERGAQGRLRLPVHEAPAGHGLVVRGGDEPLAAPIRDDRIDLRPVADEELRARQFLDARSLVSLHEARGELEERAAVVMPHEHALRFSRRRRHEGEAGRRLIEIAIKAEAKPLGGAVVALCAGHTRRSAIPRPGRSSSRRLREAHRPTSRWHRRWW